MRRFSKDVVGPYIKKSGYRSLCEVGSCDGANIDRLLAVPGMQFCCIDPCVDADLVNKYAGNPRVRVCKGLSLDTLKTLNETFDCIMIDGDHNWYTVFHELVMIHERNMLAKNGTILLHDVCWPYARRDMYYDLATVPEEWRQPAEQRGILRGMSSPDPTQGKNPDLWNATHEGGPRNGVLTAVEDFRREHPGYQFISIQREWGLGILVREGENRAAVAQLERKATLINTAEAVKTAFKTATGRISYLGH
jgi:O-antigen biosynthesis protein